MSYFPFNYLLLESSLREEDAKALAFLSAYADMHEMEASRELLEHFSAVLSSKGVSAVSPLKEVPSALWHRSSFVMPALRLKLPGTVVHVANCWANRVTPAPSRNLVGLMEEWVKVCKAENKLCYDNTPANKIGWSLFKDHASLTGLKPWVRRYAAMLMLQNKWEGLGESEDSLISRAQDVKGWRQAHEVLSPEINWTTFLAKERAADLSEEELNLAECPAGLNGVHPYKKGFDVSEYEYICIKLKLCPFTFKKDKSNGAYQACAARLVLLFGKDTVKIEQFVYNQTGSTALNLKSVHDAGQIVISNKSPFNREFWGSFIFKSSRLSNYTQYFSAYEELFDLPVSVEEFLHKVPKFIYEGVTPEHEKLAGYMWQFGYSSQEFTDILDCHIVPKQKSLIPEINQELTGSDYCVRSAMKGDPRLLVAGHLSGCCQSIFRDGHDSAVHSFEKSSSEVIWIEHKKTNKILAQMWVWLSKSRRTVVIDSIESLVRDDPAVVAICEEAVHRLKSHLAKEGFSVYLSHPNYFGITHDVALRFKGCPSVKTPSMLEQCDYIDAGAFCLRV